MLLPIICNQYLYCRKKKPGLFLISLISGLLLICVFSGESNAQVNRESRPYFQYRDPFPADSLWIAQKNAGLLSMINRNARLKKWLAADSVLSALFAGTKRQQPETKACQDIYCFVRGFSVSDSVAAVAGARLETLWKPGNLLDVLLRTELRPSGLYFQYRDSSDAVTLRLALMQDLSALNYILSVYAGGRKPNYPLIDSISLNTQGKNYVPGILFTSASVLGSDSAADRLFYQYSLRAALLFLELNGRSDPANYEPMEQTVNRAAVLKSKTISWKNYPYTLILVPGAGPGEGGTAMSAGGMLRCRLAWAAWRRKQAPFIMVSGGKVHPFKTSFCEAEEMKHYLVTVLHVPESAILMEPHARHTTTNMRNAARLIYRYGIPADRAAVVITDGLQAYGISVMESRCLKELKYMPYRLGEKLSDTSIEFYPLPDALQINPLEPLDP